MDEARYTITRTGETWTIEHDGHAEGDYLTKEAAFEAVFAAASNAIKSGMGVTITVPPPIQGESAIGGDP